MSSLNFTLTKFVAEAKFLIDDLDPKARHCLNTNILRILQCFYTKTDATYHLKKVKFFLSLFSYRNFKNFKTAPTSHIYKALNIDHYLGACYHYWKSLLLQNWIFNKVWRFPKVVLNIVPQFDEKYFWTLGFRTYL